MGGTQVRVRANGNWGGSPCLSRTGPRGSSSPEDTLITVGPAHRLKGVRRGVHLASGAGLWLEGAGSGPDKEGKLRCLLALRSADSLLPTGIYPSSGPGPGGAADQWLGATLSSVLSRQPRTPRTTLRVSHF